MIVRYGVCICNFILIRDETGVLVVEDVNDVVAAYRQQGGPMKMEPATPRVFTALMISKNWCVTLLQCQRSLSY